METTSSLIPALFLVTFVVAIAFGIWQYVKASRAKREQHTSADARVHGDAPANTPGQYRR